MSSIMSDIVNRLWTLYSGHVGLSATMAGKWWETVETRYSEPQRHYHTMTHIQHMCQLFDKYKEHLKDPVSVYYAAVFHDIIYDPTASDNEEQSDKIFQQFAKETNMNDKMLQKVSDMILLTKSHTTEAHEQPGVFGDEDHHYFLDMDMAILGSPSNDYETYTKQIREEYRHYRDDLYRHGRTQVLKSFVKTTNIFATKALRDDFEEQSRNNIQAEIEELEKGQ